MVVVCAGAKSILDLRATSERLETLGVPIVGYRTDELPGFYYASTGIQLDTCVDEVGDIIDIVRAHRSLDRRQAILVVQPPPQDAALDRRTIENAVDLAQQQSRRNHVAGGGVTPYLLDAINHLTGGGSLRANLALLERNAALATEIAVGLVRRES